MDYRLRLPSATYRILAARVGDRGVADGLRRLAALWAEEAIDPLSDDPIAQAIAQRGGRARSASMSAHARSESARTAARARWARATTADE